MSGEALHEAPRPEAPPPLTREEHFAEVLALFDDAAAARLDPGAVASHHLFVACVVLIEQATGAEGVTLGTRAETELVLWLARELGDEIRELVRRMIATARQTGVDAAGHIGEMAARLLAKASRR